MREGGGTDMATKCVVDSMRLFQKSFVIDRAASLATQEIQSLDAHNHLGRTPVFLSTFVSDSGASLSFEDLQLAAALGDDHIKMDSRRLYTTCVNCILSHRLPDGPLVWSHPGDAESAAVCPAHGAILEPIVRDYPHGSELQHRNGGGDYACTEERWFQCPACDFRTETERRETVKWFYD